ncbi:MAG TPA: lytic transglycosylase domain-containing protein [Chitinophagaceae bacterium]|nr:lytic transglycosylase domain-containing protein [Chitinophagaceae bacterium]
MLNRQVWKMSFFCQLLFLLIAAAKGRNVHPTQLAQTTVVKDSFVAQPVPLNPHAVKFVKNFIKTNNEDLLKAKERSQYCFTMMDSVFEAYELPVELKYLAVVESNLNRTAVSPVGAAGPWQLMPSTARQLGLKVSDRYDERKRFGKSTVAAAKYLRDLYNEFDDWLLAIAAYNGGPGPVYKAIRLSGSRNFWKLQNFLPMETRAHVKRYIGTHYFFEGEGSLTTLTKAETQKHLEEVAGLEMKFYNHSDNNDSAFVSGSRSAASKIDDKIFADVLTIHKTH